MTRHLKACSKLGPSLPSSAPEQPPAGQCFHLAIEGRYAKGYWMHVAVPVHASLESLDSFLREIWLECCDHLSAFTIDGHSYASRPMYGESGMGARLSRILEVGKKFSYEYDFGSTTELSLRVVGLRERVSTGGPVQLLARNDPPQVACDRCGNRPATQICTECDCSGGGWLCDDCLADHECGTEMCLPVVNSPRVGVCGYTG